MIRLFLDEPFTEGALLATSEEQAHYLGNVMRRAPGDEVLLFNGRDGEWRANLAHVSRKGARLVLLRQERAQVTGADLDLIVALVKRGRLETIVEKAAELGVRHVQPVITERTNAERTRVDRLQAIAIEAAEQTGRLDVPQVQEPKKLDRLLEDWEPDRRLLFCDEAGEAPPALEALAGEAKGGPWAILIGPEGGFSPAERERLRAQPYARAASLGPRILRADTAAIAALTLWQAALGDLAS